MGDCSTDLTERKKGEATFHVGSHPFGKKKEKTYGKFRRLLDRFNRAEEREVNEIRGKLSFDAWEGKKRKKIDEALPTDFAKQWKGFRVRLNVLLLRWCCSACQRLTSARRKSFSTSHTCMRLARTAAGH